MSEVDKLPDGWGVIDLCDADRKALREINAELRHKLDMLKEQYDTQSEYVLARLSQKNKGPGDSEMIDLAASVKFPEYQKKWEDAHSLTRAILKGEPVSQDQLEGIFDVDTQQVMTDWVDDRRSESRAVKAGIRERLQSEVVPLVERVLRDESGILTPEAIERIYEALGRIHETFPQANWHSINKWITARGNETRIRGEKITLDGFPADMTANPFSSITDYITDCQTYYERVAGTLQEALRSPATWAKRVDTPPASGIGGLTA